MISLLDAVLLSLTVAAISSGQMLFKLAAMAWPQDAGLLGLLTVPWFWAALVVYGGATVGWMMLLRSLPLSVAYPFFALAFLIVPLMSWWWLGETLQPRQWAGAALIALGVWVSVR